MQTESAIVIRAEANEHELIEIAQAAVSQSNWVVGECAAKWTRKYSRGRTDADFGQMLGLSGDQVYKCRRVWEMFGDSARMRNFSGLRWSHFYVALNWEDAEKCLTWAGENEATAAEMRAWRKAQNGEDLFSSDGSDSSEWGSPLVVMSPLIEDQKDIAPPVVVPTPKPERPAPDKPARKRPKPAPADDVLERPDATMEQVWSKTDQLLNRIEKCMAKEPDQKQLAKKYRKRADALDPPKRARFVPPDQQEVEAFCHSRGNNVDAEQFMAHYESNGWKQSNGNKIVNWQATVITWEKRDKDGSNGNNRGSGQSRTTADLF